MTHSLEIGKKEYEFDISGIKKGRIIGDRGREEALIQLIKNNPNIKHTHLLAIVEDLNLMPKVPAERILNELDDANELQSSKHGTSPNAKRTWNKNKLAENPGIIIKRLDKKFAHYEKKLKKLEKKLEGYTPPEKVSIVTSCMRMIWMLDWNIYTEKFYYPSLELSEFTKRHERIKKQLRECLENSEDGFGLFDAVERQANDLTIDAEVNFEDALDYYY